MKRHGWITCDACGREFDTLKPKFPPSQMADRYSGVPRKDYAPGFNQGWECPHCGFDNKEGEVYYENMMRCASEKSAERRRRKCDE